MGKVKDFFFKKRKVNIKALAVILVFATIFTVFVVYGNYSLETETIAVKSTKIPYEFDGYKIAHVSDFHNRESDKFQENVISALREAEPDIIVITGDIIDKHRTNTKTALLFAGELLTIAPVYYVRGNHEFYVQQNFYILHNDFIKKLEALGVKVMMNESVKLELSPGAVINLYGMDELYAYGANIDYTEETARKFCQEFNVNKDEFNVLLSHHPERIDIYAEYGFDAVFSGHAHAGQFRFFGQGILAPDQGWFPKYTSGLYEVNGSQLVLSRGLGNSTFPFRLFNKPHLIIAELDVQY